MKANELKVGDKFTWVGSTEDYGVFTVVSKKGVDSSFHNHVEAESDKYGTGLFDTEEVTLVSTTVPRTLKELDVKAGDVVKTRYGLDPHEVFEGNKLKNLKTSDEPFCFSEYWDTTDFNLVSRATEVTTTLTKPQIEVGKTYKSQNGNEWGCIFIEGDLAWLRSDSESTAYVFKTDGKPVSLAIDPRYTIKFEPTICEGVDTISSGVVHVGNDKVSINGTVTTVDGVPDWTTYVEGN